MRGLAIRKNVTYSARLIVQHRNQSNVATVGYEFPTRTDCVSHEKCLQLGATITQANMHLDTQVPPLFHYMGLDLLDILFHVNSVHSVSGECSIKQAGTGRPS
eukprot:m.8003 g.8003  ORF g.8003 m.8003 type:complete len:103 (-) comp3815_c0_seq2:853-1161(-)